MPPSKAWVEHASEIFVEELGYDKAFQLISKLRDVPGANKSVAESLRILQKGLKVVKRRE